MVLTFPSGFWRTEPFILQSLPRNRVLFDSACEVWFCLDFKKKKERKETWSDVHFCLQVLVFYLSEVPLWVTDLPHLILNPCSVIISDGGLWRICIIYNLLYHRANRIKFLSKQLLCLSLDYINCPFRNTHFTISSLSYLIHWS